MYYFIVNPHARTDQGIVLWKTLEAELDRQGVPYEVAFTEYARHAEELTYNICSRDNTTKNLVIIGGDGTVNEVINGIPDYDKVILSYIPLGSGNDLARGLALESDPLKGLACVLKPNRYRYIDHGVIHCNDAAPARTFAVSSGIGYDASVCYEALNSKIKRVLNKLKLGKLTYVILALKQLFAYHAVDMDITVDGQTTKHYKNVLFAAAMIQKYEGGGLLLAPSADPADKKLTLCVIHDISRLQVLFLLPTAFFGAHVRFTKMVDLCDCSSVEIVAQKACRVHTDGESYGEHSHLFLSCKEKQIRMTH